MLVDLSGIRALSLYAVSKGTLLDGSYGTKHAGKGWAQLVAREKRDRQLNDSFKKLKYFEYMNPILLKFWSALSLPDPAFSFSSVFGKEKWSL